MEAAIGRSGFRVWEPVIVRWADMDSYGHVNNARYFNFCESARFRYFEAVDLFADRRHEREAPALASATCNFRRQVYFPARLEVGAKATAIGRSSFTLAYEVFLEGEEEPVADGTSVVVWVDYSTGGSSPLPEATRQRIRDFDSLP